MSVLTQILEDMLAEAKVKNRSNRKLKNGLRIEIKVIQLEVTVTLWRDTIHPSLQEWNTVMRNFPYNTPSIIPQPSTEGNRFCITGRVPTQRAMQLKFG